MSALRYAAASGPLVPDPGGPAVLFADVEEAFKCQTRLAWLLPVIDGGPDAEALATQRTQALAAGLILGLRGIPLVDFAMEKRP